LLRTDVLDLVFIFAIIFVFGGDFINVFFFLSLIGRRLCARSEETMDGVAIKGRLFVIVKE